MQLLAAPGPFENPVWQANLPKPTKQLKDYRLVIRPTDERVAVAAEISARCQHTGDAYDDLITINFTPLLAKEISGFVPPQAYEDWPLHVAILARQQTTQHYSPDRTACACTPHFV
jgi:hypothetical protein